MNFLKRLHYANLYDDFRLWTLRNFYRMIIPLILFIAACSAMIVSAGQYYSTNSITAFFHITSQTEWVSLFLFWLVIYIIFIPGIISWFFNYDTLAITDSDNTLIVNGKTIKTTPDLDVSAQTLTNELNQRLNEAGLPIEVSFIDNKFDLSSNSPFTISKESTLIPLLGLPTGRDIPAVSLDYQSISNLKQTVNSRLVCETRYHVIGSKRHIRSKQGFLSNPLPGFREQPKRSWFYLAIILLWLIWKNYSVANYRGIGATIHSPQISEDNIKRLMDTRSLVNYMGVLLGIILIGLQFYMVSTRTDLTVSCCDI